jgi:tRNA threonylcarbamoyladenosine modification (KEOPS) complex  Pcc1 subunit
VQLVDWPEVQKDHKLFYSNQVIAPHSAILLVVYRYFEKNNLIIKIETKKISYLKAVINSYLSLVRALKELEE